jgi:MFS family permease
VAVLLPALLWLLRGHGVRHAAYLQRIASRSDSTTGRAESGWTRADVLKDKTFYFLLPGVMATSLVLTAMFFHHLNIAAAKGWSGEWITGNYVVYSTMTVATSLLCGPVIDRIGALRIVRVMLFPAIVGLGLLASFDTKFVVWPYMALIGVTTGVTYTAVAAMWAELYGVAHLGAIRSVATSVGIFGSALGPVIMGAGFDFGASVAMVSWCFAAYMIAASLLLWVATRPRSEKPA